MTLPRFGLPQGLAQWAALALGVLVLVLAPRFLRSPPKREPWLALALAVLALLLSWAYIHAYLRGGPRIIDATSYYLEARGFAAGRVSWPTGEPEASTLGRFLVRSEGPGGAHAAVLFPPGYPLLLALGFLAGAPLAVGPVLAAALVLATYALAREATRDDPDLAAVPLLAAALSTVCGVLRYHTADTMSHGLAALCFTLGAACLLRAAHDRRPLLWAALAGLCGGWLFATRPVSALAWAALAALLLARAARDRRTTFRFIGAALSGALPFALMWLLHQRLATGKYFLTTHAASYATNDGPAGCFRYGFGEGIGCYGEHAEFVRANLPHGFGLVAALKTTARRLWMHLADPANAEPLALLVPLGAWLARGRPTVRLLALAPLFQIAAYAPFYFDANYPAGGARLYADVLPIEHLLLAVAAVALAAKRSRITALAKGSGAWIVAFSLLAFAIRGGFDHAQLRDRDGGAPLFSADALASVAPPALVFTESDAAYNLAFDPGRKSGIEVVRHKGDGLDAVAWLERGSPPSYIARFAVLPGEERGRSLLEPYAPQRNRPEIEGESLWPPRSQEGGAYALPVHASGTCASGGRVLRLYSGAPPSGAQADGAHWSGAQPSGAQPDGAHWSGAQASGAHSSGAHSSGAQASGAVTLALPASLVGGATIEVILFAVPPLGTERFRAPVTADVTVIAGGAQLSRQTFTLQGAGAACTTVMKVAVPAAPPYDLVLEPRWGATGDPETQPYLALDRIVVVRGAP